ncbi:DMT family transporter [Pseudomonas sp. BMS12]|uniref:DMT family transporter n=1 Tax=Pseudomonas sp. BMS12 TaxID=1796033 RepID=UPI00083AA7E0|nr:DMT family transporter [Pseudomonas sp. BMS12]
MHWKTWSAERMGVVLAVLAAFGFSFKAIFVKLAYAAAPVDPVTLLTLRMTFALPFALVAALWLCRSAPPLKPRDWGLLLALGLLGYYGASILDFIGLQYISAALERLILFIYPTLTVLIGVLFMGKRLEPRQIGALVLSYAGIGLAFTHDLELADDIATVLIGAAFVFASALSYAFYSAGAEVSIRNLGTLRFAALAIIVSTFATQIHFLATQPLSALQQPLDVYAYGAAMALFSTVLPVLWQSAAVQRIGSARTVLIGTLGPILTIFFGWLLLSEPLSLAQLLGAGLVLAGVLLVSRRTVAPRQPQPPATEAPIAAR